MSVRSCHSEATFLGSAMPSSRRNSLEILWQIDLKLLSKSDTSTYEPDRRYDSQSTLQSSELLSSSREVSAEGITFGIQYQDRQNHGVQIRESTAMGSPVSNRMATTPAGATIHELIGSSRVSCPSTAFNGGNSVAGRCGFSIAGDDRQACIALPGLVLASLLRLLGQPTKALFESSQLLARIPLI